MSPHMRANGRHKVTLQKLGERIDDDAGGGSIPYEDVKHLWADIEPISGRELLRAGTNEAALTHRVRTRYYPGIKPHWRIRYEDKMLDIKYVIDEGERHRSLELMCEELVSW